MTNLFLHDHKEAGTDALIKDKGHTMTRALAKQESLVTLMKSRCL